MIDPIVEKALHARILSHYSHHEGDDCLCRAIVREAIAEARAEGYAAAREQAQKIICVGCNNDLQINSPFHMNKDQFAYLNETITALESENAKLKEELEKMTEDRERWADSACRLEPAVDHWKAVAERLAAFLSEMKHISYFDKAEGPELRAQNAALHRLAAIARADYEKETI